MFILLCIVYISFIGLGVPDSLFGTIWPAVNADFGLPAASASIVTTIISGFTVLSVALSSYLSKKWSAAYITAVSALVMAFALLGFSLSGSLFTMCLFAIPLGLAKGAPDSALNNYVALHYGAMEMNFLHCFYGVGLIASPYLMSLVLQNNSWRDGYRLLFWGLVAVAVLVFASMPLWRKVNNLDNVSEKKLISFKVLAKIPKVRLLLYLCIITGAVNGLCTVWGSSYLVETCALDASGAAGVITFFFVGMTLGRFLAGLLAARLSELKLIYISTAVIFIGVVLLFVPLQAASASGLFFVGFGNGPVYPNLMHLTPKIFGNEKSDSVISTQILSAYAGIMAAPSIFGFAVQGLGTFLLPAFLALLTILFVFLLLCFIKGVRVNR